MNVTELLLELVLMVVAVVSLVSNLSVLLCFLQSADIRAHVPGILVLNLSSSNILLTLINMPATFVGVATRDNPFADAYCKALSFSETFLTSNGMLSMAALSVDRWVAVVFPLSYSTRMGPREAFIIVAYSWLHSAAFSLSELVMSWGGYSHTYASCTLHYSGKRDGSSGTVGPSQLGAFVAFTAVLHGSGFLLCLTVMTISYLKVLRVARFHCKRIDVITVQTLLLLVDIQPSVKERCLAEQRKRSHRASKKICLFIGSFIVCFAPYVITRITQLVPQVHIPRPWGITTKCLAYAKAASDPFVYSLLRQQYRTALLGISHRILRRERYSFSTHSASSMTDVDGGTRVP
ncbi:G-protein coupled receptor 26 [Gadus morhua]|uniref:G-protein coupled receptors family 1 profile domain-containing protein n=1 Tax=Gadus morhua TaxID=8049 RepID=A0A8C5FET2_GADMO|nr:G-protein coupled receptor 26-like [Gadus morhua]